MLRNAEMLKRIVGTAQRLPRLSRITRDFEFQKILDECWDARMFKSCFKWTINNYSQYSKEPGQKIVCPQFEVGPNAETQWCVIFTPGGEIGEPSCFLSFLMMSCNDRRRPDANCVLGKLKIRCCCIDGTNLLRSYESDYQLFWVNEVIPISLINGDDVCFDDHIQEKGITLPEDGVDLLLEVSIAADFGFPGANSLRSTTFGYANQNPKDLLEELFQTQKFGDVTLAVKGKEIVAHRGVLALRSSVFNDLFMKFGEKKTGIKIEIDDLDFEVVKEMVFFIYTNRAPQLAKMAKDLFVAAEKYHLEDLKDICEEYLLLTELTIEQAPDLLRIVTTYQAKEALRKKVIQFIRENWPCIETSNSWKEMLNSATPNLLREILCLAFQKDEEDF